jgi:purine-binding chemotaxis protein CheW
MDHCRFCTFFLDGRLFGVEVERVQEVIRYQPMTRVPLAPPIIRGLINLRGQIVPALDLRRRFGLPEPSARESPKNVVVRTEDGVLSLLVDDIGDVLEVDEKSFERPPETFKGADRELIRGAYKLENHLLLVLNLKKVVTVPAPSSK